MNYSVRELLLWAPFWFGLGMLVCYLLFLHW
jgi:hypothetical protein